MLNRTRNVLARPLRVAIVIVLATVTPIVWAAAPAAAAEPLGWYRQGASTFPSGLTGGGLFMDVSAGDAGTAYAVLQTWSGNGHIYKTGNGGTTWAKQYAVNGKWFHLVKAANKNTAWAACNNSSLSGQVYATKNGSTWALQKTFDYGGSGAQIVAMDAVSASVAWIITETDTQHHQAWRTLDGGTTWSNTGQLPVNLQLDSDDDHPLPNIMSAMDANKAWVACYMWSGGKKNGLVYRTTNGGASWQFQYGVTDTPLYGISMVNSNTGWAVGWNSAIIRTDDGGAHWSWQRGGIRQGTRIRAVKAADTSTAWILLQQDNETRYLIHKTEDGGASWGRQLQYPNQADERVYSCSPAFMAIDAFNGQEAWAVGTAAAYPNAETYIPGGVFHTSHGGGVLCNTSYLAEGTTAWGFQTYLSVLACDGSEQLTQDPILKMTYMLSGASTITKRISLDLAPHQYTFTNDYLKGLFGERDFSVKIETEDGEPLAADRTMEWTGQDASAMEAHNSVGVGAPAKNWYFPEGSTKWGFETWLLIQNPNPAEASCDVTFMIEGEGPRSFNYKVPGNSRATFNMADAIGAQDASIKVQSNVPVIPERAMYRNNRREGHDSVGTTEASKTYFLAEGTSGWGFTTYVLVQNPNNQPCDVTLTYMTPSGPRGQPAFTMPPNSRKTIRMNDSLPGTDASTKVEASLPITAERAMYWDNGTGEACHDSIGVSSAHAVWRMADGDILSSGKDVETYLLVQNPNNTSVTVEVVGSQAYGGMDSRVVLQDTIPANSRKTYDCSSLNWNWLGQSRIRFGISVTSLVPGTNVIAERAMYFGNRGGGTDTVGGFTD